MTLFEQLGVRYLQLIVECDDGQSEHGDDGDVVGWRHLGAAL